MPLAEQQKFLARLYTDERLRREFFDAPGATGWAHDLTADEIAEIAGMMAEELDYFAATLFWKRLREAEKLLPLTKRLLGEEFTTLFRAFSAGYNPQSIKKHLEDALQFAAYLARADVSGLARDAARFEAAKLKFYGTGRKIVVCRLSHDVTEITRGEPAAGAVPKKKRLAVWIRIGKQNRHFVI
jgi:hypothetical protein